MVYQFLESPPGKAEGDWPQLAPTSFDPDQPEKGLMGSLLGTLLASEPFLRAFVDYFQMKGNSAKATVASNATFLSESPQLRGPFDGYVRLPGFAEASDLLIQIRREPIGQDRDREIRELQNHIAAAAAHTFSNVATLGPTVPDHAFLRDVVDQHKTYANRVGTLTWMNTYEIALDALVKLSSPRERWLIEQYVRSLTAYVTMVSGVIDGKDKQTADFFAQTHTMGDDWRWLVQEFKLNRSDPEFRVRVQSCVRNWYSLMRLLTVINMRDAEFDPIAWKVEAPSFRERIEAEISNLVKTGELSATIQLQNTKSSKGVRVSTDFVRRTLTLRDKQTFKTVEEFEARLVRSLYLKKIFNEMDVQNYLYVHDKEGQQVRKYDADRTTPLSGVFEGLGRGHTVYSGTRIRMGLDMADPSYYASSLHESLSALIGTRRRDTQKSVPSEHQVDNRL